MDSEIAHVPHGLFQKRSISSYRGNLCCLGCVKSNALRCPKEGAWNVDQVGLRGYTVKLKIKEGEVIASLYSLSQRQSENRIVFTDPETTNCFGINFQDFTNNHQINFRKIQFQFITVLEKTKKL